MGLARKATSWAVVALFGVLCSAVPAAAQDDPYGSTSTTRPAPRRATIELSVSSGPPGTQVEAYACGYAPGTGGGSITFSGEVVASGLTAAADGCLVTGAGSAPTFVVPEDAQNRSHPVCAVVAGYNTPCARFQVRSGPGRPENPGGGRPDNPGGGRPDSNVLGASATRDEPSSGQSSSGGSLPSTGLALGLLASLGLALLLGGRAMLDSSRRRRSSASP